MKRRRVVHAIADHRDHPAGALELGDLLRLVAGKHFRNHGVDTQLPGDSLRGGLVVSGEHHDLHSEFV